MEKLSTQDLATALIEKCGIGNIEAQQFVVAMFDVIRAGVERDKLVKVKGLGTFKLVDVESRESVNVNTGERVLIEGHGKITFTPDSSMKELVNRPFSSFETVILQDGVEFDDAPVTADDSDTTEMTEDTGDTENTEMSEITEETEITENIAVEEETVAEETVAEVEVVVEPEPEPEPVVEDIPEPEPDPVVEETLEPEPEPEPEVEETPASEPESEIVETPEIEPEVEEEPEIEEEPEVEDDADETEKPHRSYGVIITAVLIALVVGFVGGYFTANSGLLAFGGNNDDRVAVKDSVETKDTVAAAAVKDSIETIDSIENIEPIDSIEKTEPMAKPEKLSANAPDYLKYNEMDNRLRHGAYYIMGVDHLEKAREGDNLHRIARRTIGEECICYIEVLNGIKETDLLKTGQLIKIPKLKTKKSVEKINN